MSEIKSEVKLNLKEEIISYTGKPLRDTTNLMHIQLRNSTLTAEQLLEKCPVMTWGKTFATLLVQVPTKDPKETLKLFRWASKIEDKLITDKGELSLDLNQVTELYDFISKVQTSNTVTIAPILIKLEMLKEELAQKKQ